MSDHWIRIIPEDPDFVPDNASQQSALSYFRRLAPKADNLEVSSSDRIVFKDCGGNFESIACSACGADFALEQWHNWVDEDYDGEGFTLTEHPMPCCGARRTLHQLRYSFPQGFGRFEVSAMNPQIGELSEEQCDHFQQFLGCPVRVIYRHL